MKLFIGDSCMLHFFVENLKSENLCNEIFYTYHEGTSTCIFDEINNPDSVIYTKEFDYYMIGMGDTLRQELYYQITSGANDKNKDFNQIIDSLINRLVISINKIREVSSNPIFLDTYAINVYQNKMFSYKFQENPIKYHYLYLIKLYEIAEQYDNVFIFDINKVLGEFSHSRSVYRHELHGSHIERGAGKPLVDYFKQLIEGISPAGKIKVVVVDLDNTMWPGVLRESSNDPKANYFRLQVISELALMGIVICVCSKNDDDAETLDRVKRILGYISTKIPVFKINWNRKSDNIQEIAKQLNVGLDSIAFFDDQEFERDEVKQSLPQVNVFKETDLDLLFTDGRFNLHKVSKDAKNRHLTYQQNITRESDEISSNYGNYEDYLKTLDMKLTVRKFSQADLTRTHELITRTNQQNFTLNRFTEDDIMSMSKDDSINIFLVEMEDKFGPYGIIGTIITKRVEDSWKMIEFALSCRAMGKRVEETIFTALVNLAHLNKSKSIKTDVKRTDKNTTIVNQLTSFGFVEKSNEFEILIDSHISYPSWFTVTLL